MSRSITLPHTTLLNGQNQTSTFPCTVDQALALYPWVQTRCAELLLSLLDGRHFSQFTGLVKLLTGSSSSVAAGSSQSPKTDNTNYFQVESQNMMNQERDLLHQNSKLKRGKRLSEEHILHMPAFKRRKLDKVGNRSIFDTDRKKYKTDVETGRLGTGFTDVCIIHGHT